MSPVQAHGFQGECIQRVPAKVTNPGKGRLAVCRSRHLAGTHLTLGLCLLLAVSPLHAAEPEKTASSSLLQGPMLESDWPRVTPPSPMRTSQPTLLDIPGLDDSLPSAPTDTHDVLAPSLLTVTGPRLQPPADPTVDDPTTEPDPLYPTAPRTPDPTDPSLVTTPETPEANPFVNPQLTPAPSVAPQVFGVPNPLLDLTPAPGAELAPETQIQLNKRYALHLRALVSGIYDDSSVISINGKKPDLILSVAPEVAFTAGTDQSRAALRIAYVPLINWYTQGTNKDGVDHNVQLNSRFQIGKLLLGANFSAATSISGGSLDTGPATETQSYLASITSLYQFSGKFSLDSILDETVVKTTGASNTDETRFQAFGNYQLGHFKLGLGALMGFVDNEGASTQRYIQSLSRVIYAAPGRKLSLNAVAGYEYRNLGGDQGHSTDPVFQIGASYLLFPHTTLSVSTQRHVYASVSSVGQNFVLITFDGMIRQGFTGYGRNFFLSLAGGLQTSKYSGGGNSGGENDYFYTRVSFDWAFRERALLSGFYEYSENSSTQQGALGFKRNRVGLQVTVIFF